MIVRFIVIVLVILGGIVLTLAGFFETTSIETHSSWSINARSPISYHQVDLDGDGERDLFVEDETGFHVLDRDGMLHFSRQVAAPFAAAVMRVDADDTFEIVLYEANADVVILNGDGSEHSRFSAATFAGGAGRMRIAGPEQDEIVLADSTSNLAAFSAQGTLLWQADPLPGALRALVRLPDELGGQVVIGDEDGHVAIYDAAGRELWSTRIDGGLRRLRAFEVDGSGQVFVGGVGGQLNVHDALSGDVRWMTDLGQSVDEIRQVELDGNPATTEIAVGGREGGVWVYNAAGNRLWSAQVNGKVNELTSLNTSDHGHLLAVGDESGTVTVFDASGNHRGTLAFGNHITLLQNDPRLGQDRLLIGNSSGLQLWQPDIVTGTNYVLPLAGIVVVSGLVLAGSFISNQMTLVSAEREERSKRLQVLARSEEELVARWRVLREKARDLDDARGSFSNEVYLERLRSLRDEMALVSGALEKRGITPEIKVIKCPTCGGPVDTRNDRCEFCGSALTQYTPR